MSGIRFLLDTNFVIGLMKGDGPAVALERELDIPTNGNALSQISRIELFRFRGLTSDSELQVRTFVSFCDVLLIRSRVEAKTFELRRATKLKLPDTIIAATALVFELKLVTLDLRLEQAMRDWVGL